MKFTWRGQELYIDKWLAIQLDSLIYNVKKDWDFVGILSGNRMVRIGKSVLAQTICAYLAYGLEKRGLNPDSYDLNNIYFDNKVLVTDALKKSPYNVIHYDEGREGLAASKTMKQFQQDLLDFFTECGQLNHIFIIVAPDFFELKEEIAVGRSEFLINVYRASEKKMIDLYKDGEKRPVTKFTRGFFQFFSRDKKAWLYDKFRTTRKKNYKMVIPDFIGRFTDQYPLGEEPYKEKKRVSLTRFEEKHKKEKELKLSPKHKQLIDFRNAMLLKWRGEGLTYQQIRAKVKELGFELSAATIGEVVQKHKAISELKNSGDKVSPSNKAEDNGLKNLEVLPKIGENI